MLKEKHVIKNFGGGSGGGREARAAGWQRVLGMYFILFFALSTII